MMANAEGADTAFVSPGLIAGSGLKPYQTTALKH